MSPGPDAMALGPTATTLGPTATTLEATATSSALESMPLEPIAVKPSPK